jgi:hypothetical protein
MFKRTSLAIMFLLLSTPASAALIDLNPRAHMAVAISSTTTDEAQGDAIEVVEGSYRLKGHLLALVPVSFMVDAKAHANGEVELDYPWFAYITVSRRQELETELRVAIDNARHARLRGSVRAEGEPVNPQFSAEEAEAVKKEMKRILGQ